MPRHHESNPHFHTRRNDPVIEFSPPSQHQHRPHHPPDLPPSKYPPYASPTSSHQSHTAAYPPHAPPPQSSPRIHRQSRPHEQPPPPPHHDHPHFTPYPVAPQPHSPGSGRHSPGHHHHHRRHRDNLMMPTSRRTNPLAWLVAAFCALFWIIVIIGGLIILIVYLVFRPRNPRFDISTATLNAAYLDMGYLLNADVTILANFTNPNTKVKVDFTYVVLDIYYEERFIATRYIDPFSVGRRESRFADVHMVASQVRLSMGHSVELQRQMAAGRVNFEIRGLFKTRSRFGGFFQYTYWLNAHCHIVLAGPPTGVLIGKRCVTKR